MRCRSPTPRRGAPHPSGLPDPHLRRRPAGSSPARQACARSIDNSLQESLGDPLYTPGEQVTNVAVEVGLHLRLGRHRLRPDPFLLDLVGEAVRVFNALDVTAGTGVAVVQPSAADIFGHFQHTGPQPEL